MATYRPRAMKAIRAGILNVMAKGLVYGTLRVNNT